MSIHLIFSNNSVKNTTVECDSLGIHYEASKKHNIVSVTHWDSSTDQMIPVGQYHFPDLGKGLIKLPKDADWRPLKELLHKRPGAWWFPNRAFTADDRTVYQWKLERKGLAPNLVLYHDDAQKGTEPLVKYHLNRFSSKSTYLELIDSSLLGSLDLIVLTFLVMETKKREDESGLPAD
ncbi:hypothetical protein CPB86DRAFT_790067 [Serendipita vermifera]|nr:hypothetical protein CPB86DRAFT_790067 [Serendipita vermifera]